MFSTCSGEWLAGAALDETITRVLSRTYWLTAIFEPSSEYFPAGDLVVVFGHEASSPRRMFPEFLAVVSTKAR